MLNPNGRVVCAAANKRDDLELTPFDGHLIVHQEGVQDAQTAHPQTAELCDNYSDARGDLKFLDCLTV